MDVGTGCAICAKHRGEGPLVGPLVWSDDLVVVSHRPVSSPGTGVAPGYLFVESRRHVERWQHLTREEAMAVAEAGWIASRVLAGHFATPHVFSAIVGMGVAHFHQHVFLRPASTPGSVPWPESGTWPGAVTVTADELDLLVDELASTWAAQLRLERRDPGGGRRP
ncbi:diadenosine tetraphosphate (Ap4A) HIT family hydrolase [Kineococcus xinjiangensis]|uniref:Diadenosine tetraphosphate (Ap4A) HIT family hydrolase n=1 Tax=Kineococcus xinjiangensis TaxID=512762 RepID=A0A2S6IEN7_9ACTN|nr:histidine triad (HIT) protein [Kineococcus xinjiangensis]PPK92669.1 diadenosine tetraphosphate (Ap4A) HIT family hydrolase [Kineococcus xinjiangensis]